MLRGVPANQRWNWENRDKKTVPAEHVLAIYEQRVNEAGGPPPPDPFATYEAALKRGLTLMIEWYTVTPDPAKFDHWVATIGGFRNGLARAMKQDANADRLDAMRAMIEGTAADADVQDAAG